MFLKESHTVNTQQWNNFLHESPSPTYIIHSNKN